jgi:hypothetical protein
MLTRASIDTCNPETAESTLLVATIAVCVREAFFYSVFGDGVDFRSGTEVPFGHL